MSPDHDDKGTGASSSGGEAEIVRYVVNDLLRGGREAILEHNGFEYHLRITSNGRLILTK